MAGWREASLKPMVGQGPPYRGMCFESQRPAAARTRDLP